MSRVSKELEHSQEQKLRDFYFAHIMQPEVRTETIGQFGRMLWDAYGDTVFLLALRRLGPGQRETAKDVCQETFTRALQVLVGNADTRRHNINFRSWLRRIAWNHMTDEGQAAWRRKVRSATSTDPGDAQATPLDFSDSRTPLPHENASRDEQLAWLRACLEELEGIHLTLVQLVDLRGMTQTAAAEELDLPIATAWRRLRDAHMTIRNCIDGKSGGQGGGPE